MKNEKMYMVKFQRDDDRYWGYDKTFDQYVTKNKENAFNKAIDELRNIVKTIRGRNSYPGKIVESVEHFLKLLDSKEKEFYDFAEENYFNKDEFDVNFYFNWGNARFNIDIVDVLVSSNGTDFSFIEIED